MPTFWARWGDVTVSAEMVLIEAKLGLGRELIESIARRKVAAAMAWERGVTVSERDVEAAVTRFYSARGLTTLDEIRDWRTRYHLKEEVVRSYLREQHLIDRLRDQLAPDAAVEAYFATHRAEHEQAEIERYAFSSERAASDFLHAVEGGEIEPRMGARLRLTRAQMPPAVAEAFAAAAEGQLAGPVLDSPKTYFVYRFLRWEAPHLTAELREQIRETLFREALAPLMPAEGLTFMI